ncbi:hypothetical protein AURANDRAFT_70945 [Aureococcus anophagefferens]|uniref:Uncharacterized protein n=1 Tax=Aureococcus anophagefferens TaxID=44056 RepID=F0Y013_AURAN|nr:hypothetical protein AURANDRAFT_70945 [Aureococcus anophagefferens]EGB11522.1 hypothetical protein AURANDRAFT_70945 [Aureococcus anophagefferens]|eukprot:XP_009033880.1 hypothetical protein AURANDRAFT_70945 [Aureococcus anophagefferens]
MALVVAPPPTLTAVAWQQSDDREATYDKLVAILSEAPSETCSLLSYEQDSEPEERLAAEAAEARALEAYAPCLVGAALRDLRDAGAAHAARRRGAARALAAACRVAGARPGLAAALRRAGLGRSAASRAALNCAGAALRYGDGAALAAALEIRARCGPGREPPDYAGRWCGVALAALRLGGDRSLETMALRALAAVGRGCATDGAAAAACRASGACGGDPAAPTPAPGASQTQPDDDSHWDVALLNRLGAPCAEARALAVEALRAFAPVVARARPLAAAVAARTLPAALLPAWRAWLAEAHAPAPGDSGGAVARRSAVAAAAVCDAAAAALNACDPLPVFRDRVDVATGLVKILSKCKTAVQRYAAHDDTAPGDDAAAACLGSFFGAWAAVYACMRASDAPRRAKFLKSQGAMIAKPYKACFAGVPGVREAVLVLVGDAAAAGRLGAVLGSFGGAGVVEACARGAPPGALDGALDAFAAAPELDVASALAVVGARAAAAPLGAAAAAAFQRVLDRDVDGAALDAARALALAPRAEDDDGLFDAFVRARYGAPEDLRALATEARAAKLGACLEAELLEPALAGARGLEPDLLLAFWTAATRGRRADAPSAALLAWPALHALAIKDGAWLDASMSRQRLDELARLAADAASAPELLLDELDARHAAAGDADLKQRPRLAAVAAGLATPLADAAGADGLPAAARVCARAFLDGADVDALARALADLAGPDGATLDAGALAAVAPLLAAAFGDDALAPVADAALRVVRGDLRLPAALTVALGAFRRRGLGASPRAAPSPRAPEAPRAPEPPRAPSPAAKRPSPERPPPESPKRRKFVAPDKDRPHAFGDCVVQSRSAAGPTTTKKKHDDEGRLRAARALLESQHSESQSQDSEPQKRASVLCYTSLASSQGPDLPGAWAAKFDASQRPSPEDA